MSESDSSNSDSGNAATFETSIQELESLVRKLEQGDMPLEESLKAFERGVQLTRSCQQSLRDAEQRVEQVIENSQGELETRPFPEDSSEA
ncbi:MULTISPECIES: exodeoxyribonuclease VII small subunit [Gammaproteobacteria]|uniref:Exodeoxyribonuclease 7 small subunit n=1 Tax=Vreelandella halophila TaxID=86177 RepID=A0A9X4YBG8_9GAMM|nr:MULTISPECIES: exodeoxyribonuclease VII small subunit [Gammaproteobacteria]KAA8980699.1 exodeoxyribonuclease VII small subunit [Halospina sp. K52047b]MYL26642.1 exodeoxyribonuclease VII small subunit [Halomonas utahensis]MYL73979.1 exodeoxyribonuclease VII small subunit [Halomonas sp. 22501_18_FS]